MRKYKRMPIMSLASQVYVDIQDKVESDDPRVAYAMVLSNVESLRGQACTDVERESIREALEFMGLAPLPTLADVEDGTEVYLPSQRDGWTYWGKHTVRFVSHYGDGPMIETSHGLIAAKPHRDYLPATAQFKAIMGYLV